MGPGLSHLSVTFSVAFARILEDAFRFVRVDQCLWHTLSPKVAQGRIAATSHPRSSGHAWFKEEDNLVIRIRRAQGDVRLLFKLFLLDDQACACNSMYKNRGKLKGFSKFR